MASELKILQVCLSGSWGGLEMTALEQTEWLLGLGHQVLNVVRPGTPLEEKLQKLAAPILAPRGPLSAWKIRKSVTAFEPDLIVHQQLRDLTYHRLFFPPGTPAVGFLHMFLSVNKKDAWHRFHYAALNKLIVLTEAQKANALEHLPIANERIEVIPNGVDTVRFHPNKRDPNFKAKLGLDTSTFLVGVVGRFDPQKGQMETLEALHNLRAHHPKLRVLFVGEDTINSPGTEKKMREFISAHHLENIALVLPFQPDIPSVMASLDLFLMPSYGETFGRVLIEAMASAVPVMGTRAGGVVSLMEHGVDGLLIEPKSSKAIEQGLRDCLMGTYDLQRLGDRARDKAVQKLEAKVVQEQILNSYWAAAQLRPS